MQREKVIHILKFVVWNSIKLKEEFPWLELSRNCDAVTRNDSENRCNGAPQPFDDGPRAGNLQAKFLLACACFVWLKIAFQRRSRVVLEIDELDVPLVRRARPLGSRTTRRRGKNNGQDDGSKHSYSRVT